MKLEDFKSLLITKTHITYELVKSRFDEEFSGFDTLEELINNKEEAHEVIDWLCDWDETSEGIEYWKNIYTRI